MLGVRFAAPRKRPEFAVGLPLVGLLTLPEPPLRALRGELVPRTRLPREGLNAVGTRPRRPKASCSGVISGSGISPPFVHVKINGNVLYPYV